MKTSQIKSITNCITKLESIAEEIITSDPSLVTTADVKAALRIDRLTRELSALV